MCAFPVFSRFYSEVVVLFFSFILCLLWLANIGLRHCLSLGSLLVHGRCFFIFRDIVCVYACFASQTSIGFVQCYSLDSLQFFIFYYLFTHAVLSYNMSYDHVSRRKKKVSYSVCNLLFFFPFRFNSSYA